MKFATWLLVIFLAFAIFRTQRSVRSSQTVAERFFAIRVSAFCWLLGFGFLVALVFLPNKQRILLMIPLFFVSVTLAKLWRNGQTRLRRERETRDQFERAKRIN